MRTTVRLDDDLLEELREFARAEGTSLAKLFNRAARAGLQAMKRGKTASKKPFRQKTFNTGKPKVDLTKALQLAAQLEDEEIIKKLRLGK